MPRSPRQSPEPRNPGKAALLALAVASGEPLLKAAQRIGIGERTAKRWNRSPRVRAKVDELRSALVSEAVGKLSSEASQAVEMLARIMRSPRAHGEAVRGECYP